MFTLCVPGIETLPDAATPRLPALERLLVRGRGRPLQDSPWAALARLAGGELQRWPVGPVSALGELDAPPPACLRAEPLGAEHERHGVFRLPAATLAITRAEAEALAEAFGQTFGDDGLRLEIASPERWYLALAGDAGGDHSGAPGGQPGWRGFDRPAGALADDQRPAPPEAGLRLLLSELEMLFHAHPVNAARREHGVAEIAGLHPWGGGRLEPPAGLSPLEPAVAEEPFLAGLRRLGAVRGRGHARFDSAAQGAGDIAWPMAIETHGAAGIESIEDEWAAPLLSALRRGRVDGVRIVTGRAVHETRRRDVFRFWQRSRPLGELC
jgi:hypothetical protein